MKYDILDPTGNITAIISEPTDLGSRLNAAAEVMALEPETEQAGFLLPQGEGFDGELQMAGGEFCGNASISAAASIAMNKGAKAGDKFSLTLIVSGADKPVKVDLAAISSVEFKGKVSMPKALEIINVEIPGGNQETVPVVIMPGIAHAIVDESMGISEAENILPKLCKKLDAEAMGIMLVNHNYSKITPVVYVPNANTLVREHSCASGSAAVGAYIAFCEKNAIRREFSEPGGILTVSAIPEGEITIEGTVLLKKRVE